MNEVSVGDQQSISTQLSDILIPNPSVTNNLTKFNRDNIARVMRDFAMARKAQNGIKLTC